MKLEQLKETASRLPVVGIVVRAVRKGRLDHGMDMAASIAFFSFFSIFPLGLGFLAIGSLFLQPDQVQQRLDQLFATTLPVSAEFVRRNVEALVELRGAASFISVVGILWSASKMFGAMGRGINRALGLERTIPVYLSPLRQFLLTLLASLLLYLSMTVGASLEILLRADPHIFGRGVGRLLTFAGGHVASFVFVLLTMAALYSFIPYRRPRWRAMMPGLLLAACMYEGGKSLFEIYIDNLAVLQTVYGPITSIIVLMLWLYYAARVLLFGAEMIAVVQEERNEGPAGDEPDED